MLIPVILAGGSGTRLWPLSRRLHPKQFLALNGKYSLLQETAKRVAPLCEDELLVVCHEAHRFLTAEHLRTIGFEEPRVLLEPDACGTAPAIALAALDVCSLHDDPMLLVVAADHIIKDADSFERSVKAALRTAQQGWLVTFGVSPSRPEAGYGYIKVGEGIESGGNKVDQFVEKPTISEAEEYIKTGEYLWNTGFFLFKARAYLSALERFQPNMLSACRSAYDGVCRDGIFLRPDRQAYQACPSDSIDYAILEHADNVAVARLDTGWSDIGSWSALWDEAEKDAANNVGSGDVIFRDAENCLAYSTGRLVAALGVSDLVIVETSDAVLISRKECAQDVKALVSQLDVAARTEHVVHTEVYRPWGKFNTVQKGERFQVKKITVNPGAKLSVQMHHHRAEHWIVVSGTAKVLQGDKHYLLTENQSTYIPIGQVHSLENPGMIPLELIEVQSGAYLGEDDIVRMEDKYGRV